MAKKSLSKIQIEMNDSVLHAQAKNKTAVKRTKAKAAKKAREEMSEYIAAEMEGEV